MAFKTSSRQQDKTFATIYGALAHASIDSTVYSIHFRNPHNRLLMRLVPDDEDVWHQENPDMRGFGFDEQRIWTKQELIASFAISFREY